MKVIKDLCLIRMGRYFVRVAYSFWNDKGLVKEFWINAK